MKINCGIDEAGRGALAGPVVAAAVILPSNEIIQGLDDSKKITKKNRDKLFLEIVELGEVGIGFSSHRVIDKINILNATHLAMSKAFSNIKTKPDQILVDGINSPLFEYDTRHIIGGDGKVDCIGAASIVAKVVRDRFMSMLDRVFPNFNFSKHKGYGTKEHFDSLKKNSLTEIHRKTFTPVKNLIKSRNYKDSFMDSSNSNLEEINIEINNWLRMIGLLN
ncbi:MAG: ribonuclease HII [bacterium TMED144]|nr:MAG: ribonuclease HII [bacterium TMED144]|tara:strand:+ start:245 stop:907 length:663 start_codon:yes stop_codon:yes gene_type:complete